MLMSDDQDIESESDFEIDPGTITPPSASPVQREESPTLQDILSTVSSTDGNELNFCTEVLLNEFH